MEWVGNLPDDRQPPGLFAYNGSANTCLVSELLFSELEEVRESLLVCVKTGGSVFGDLCFRNSITNSLNLFNQVRKHFLPWFILGLPGMIAPQFLFAETHPPEEPAPQQTQQTQPAKTSTNARTSTNKDSSARVPSPSPQWKKTQRTLVRNGIALQLEVEPLEEPESPGAKRAGRTLRVRLALHDDATQTPLTGLHPSVWMSLREGADVPCNTRARAFLRRALMEKQPDLDLNDYYVLALNQDETIHVVDPQFSSGRTRLLASIALPGRAADWALSPDQSKLYVSISQPGEIVMIDTATWTIIHRAKIPGAAKLALQPDNHYLWSSYAGTESGMAVLSAANLQQAARIRVPAGRHDVAFSNDSRIAFVTNPGAATVSLIDVARLTQTKELKTGNVASSIAYSAASQSAYVTTTSGSILAINDNGEIAGRIAAEPGLAHIAFFRDGRIGLVLNPEKGLLHVIDTARNVLLQTASIGAAPEQIVFSDQLAYIIRRDSDLIEMVPLDVIGTPRGAVSTVDLPAGHSAFSHASADELTKTMVQASGENAVVIANAGDRSVFYYEEGMAAPMGTFSNFGKAPRSVLVVDRSLKERSPGVYEATGRLEKAGTYIVPVLLDSPRIVECFAVPLGVEDNGTDASPDHR
jgi:DNA-binding beta-propeller fold protein YncE